MERALASALATKHPRGDKPGPSHGSSALGSWRHSCLGGLTTWQLNRVVAVLVNEHMVSQREVKYSLPSCSFQKHLLCKAGGWMHTPRWCSPSSNWASFLLPRANLALWQAMCVSVLETLQLVAEHGKQYPVTQKNITLQMSPWMEKSKAGSVVLCLFTGPWAITVEGFRTHNLWQISTIHPRQRELYGQNHISAYEK